jgi:hypothetical protein
MNARNQKSSAAVTLTKETPIETRNTSGTESPA